MQNNFLTNKLKLIKLNKKIFQIFFSLFLFFIIFFPIISQAQVSEEVATLNLGTFRDFANSFTTNVIASLGTVFMAMAFMFFAYGVAMYIFHRAEGKEMGKDQAFMIWGLVGLFVMVSVWGIIKLAQSIIGEDFDSSNDIAIQPVNFNIKQDDSSNKRLPATPVQLSLATPVALAPITPGTPVALAPITPVNNAANNAAHELRPRLGDDNCPPGPGSYRPRLLDRIIYKEVNYCGDKAKFEKEGNVVCYKETPLFKDPIHTCYDKGS